MAEVTARDVVAALCGLGSNCLWDPRRVVAVPNTTAAVGWEADLLILHPSGWVWEIEVKVSAGDFRREFKTKADKHETLKTGTTRYRGGYGYYERKNEKVQKFFFAMPLSVYERVKDEVPDYAGVILLDEAWRDGWNRLRPRTEKKAPNLPGAKKTDDAFRIELLRLAHARLWSAVYKNHGLLDLREEKGV